MRFDRLTKVDLYFFSPRHGGEIVLFCRPTFTDIFSLMPLAPPRVIFRVIGHKVGAIAYLIRHIMVDAATGVNARLSLLFGGPTVHRPGIVGIKPCAVISVCVLAQPTNGDIGR